MKIIQLIINLLDPKKSIQQALCLLLALLVCSCNITKQIDSSKGERLLVKNSLEFVSTKKLPLSKKTGWQSQMGGLYKQPTMIGLGGYKTRLAAKYRNSKKNTRFVRRIKEKMGEPPIYNEDLKDRTALSFQNFMRQRGYSQAVCIATVDSIGDKKMAVQYKLFLGQLYTVNSMEFMSRDSNVLAILQKNKDATNLKKGTPLDITLFDAEKNRITNLLRNNGYAYFIPNYIEFGGDSTGTSTAVTVEVLPQNDSTWHQVYYLDDVSVFASVVPEVTEMKNEAIIDSIRYYSKEKEFFIKPKYLNDLIETRPGQLFRQEDFDRTNRNLSTLGVFSFVAVRQKIDPLDSLGQLDVETSFAPADKMEISNYLGLDYSTSAVSGGQLGAAASVQFKNRNLFRGAEQISTNFQFNTQFNLPKAANENLIFSLEGKVENDLTIPRFIDYFKIWKGLNAIRPFKLKEGKSSFYRLLKRDAKSHIRVNYNYLDLTNFYTYNLVNASFGYKIQKNNEQTILIDQLGIDWLDPTLNADLCKNNPFLCKSFDPQLFTGFLLRSASFNLSTLPNRFNERWFFRFSFETSGLEVGALNSIWNRIANDKEWRIGNLDFAKYFRFETTGGYTRNFTKDLAAAFRIASGVVIPYNTEKTTPYVKQFFVGGPSSIRGWRIRELGPGDYFDPATSNVVPFSQASDFRLEFNAEIRFPIFWWFKGAIFLDGGNIWSLKSDDRLGSRLTINSYRDVALSTGAGIRLDIGYSIIRLDLGLKFHDPQQSETTRWVNWTEKPFREFSNWNLAVGYPF